MNLLEKIFLIVFILLLAFCPWLNYNQATSIYNSQIERAENLQSFCDFQIKENSLHKVAFGFLATISFDCNYGDTPHLPNGENQVFLGFWKGTIGMPHPVVR